MSSTTGLPEPRGALPQAVTEVLRGTPGSCGRPPGAADGDPFGEDVQLALYCCYELHYRGFAGVDPEWEWDAGLLRLRGVLERSFLAALRGSVPSAGGDVEAALEPLLTQGTRTEPGPRSAGTPGPQDRRGTGPQDRRTAGAQDRRGTGRRTAGAQAGGPRGHRTRGHRTRGHRTADRRNPQGLAVNALRAPCGAYGGWCRTADRSGCAGKSDRDLKAVADHRCRGRTPVPRALRS
jgi:hypothetical protein